MLNRLIRVNKTINKMVLNGEIKTEWSELEQYGISTMLSAFFEEELNYEEVDACIMKKNGAVVEGFFDGIEYDGDILEWAYITTGNDIVLTSYDESVVYLLKTGGISVEDFDNSPIHTEEWAIGDITHEEDFSAENIKKENIISEELKNIQQLKKRLTIALKLTEIRELELEMLLVC